MTTTLYGDIRSRAHRCVWMLKELGVPFVHVPTSFLDGSTRSEDFRQINPNGRVPALVDGDLHLFESLAINLYLAKRHGGPLAPADLREDALMTQWTLWVITEVEKPLLLASANRFLFDEPLRRTDEAEVMLAKLERPFHVLDAHLRTRSHIVGERFTVADLNVAAVLSLGVLAGLPFQAWPCLQDWLGRCLERPAAADWKPIRFRVPRPPTALGVLQMFV